MNPYLTENKVLDNSVLDDFISNKELEIASCLDLNNGKSLVSYQNSDLLLETNANVNISIAAAITAYARIHMSQFLGNPLLNVLYTDTDSIDIDQPLDPKFIGKDLGKMKLEYVFNKAIFLAPKVYGGILEDGTELTKVKGFKNSVPYSDLKTLLTKGSELELNQEKWFRSIEDGNITILEQLYKLVPTENKRQIIYSNNRFVNTKPFIIKQTKFLKSFMVGATRTRYMSPTQRERRTSLSSTIINILLLIIF
jgi:hypothetical protein